MTDPTPSWPTYCSCSTVSSDRLVPGSGLTCHFPRTRCLNGVGDQLPDHAVERSLRRTLSPSWTAQL
jgi:hypothetical protein